MRTAPALYLALAVPALARAQSAGDSLDLSGRSNIVIGIGLTGARKASSTSALQTSRTGGELGSFSFNHWVRSQLAVQRVRNVAGVPIQLGGNYY